jgi:phosphotransferase system  glucose/maltose/N-acetylglucosamine-specific IIC component
VQTDTRTRYVRKEPHAHRLDRNYSELLQELRVVQTGVQILFAFLLAIAFQQRFGSVSGPERGLFLVALLSAACSSVLLTAPAAVHRILFRYNVKDEIVDVTARLVKAGMLFLAVAMVTGVTFVVMFVAGVAVAIALAGGLALLVAVTWVLAPQRRRRRCAVPPEVAGDDLLIRERAT